MTAATHIATDFVVYEPNFADVVAGALPRELVGLTESPDVWQPH